jgi:hypothetical protein
MRRLIRSCTSELLRVLRTSADAKCRKKSVPAATLKQHGSASKYNEDDMELTDQQVTAIKEALEMAHIALTTEVSVNDLLLAAALTKLRLGQLIREEQILAQKRAPASIAVSI